MKTKHKTLDTFHDEERARERKMKTVRIDCKTTIIVPVDVPDDEARETYLLKLKNNERRFVNYQRAEQWE